MERGAGTGPPALATAILGRVDRHWPKLFPLPALVLVGALGLYPLVYTLVISTRSYDLALSTYRFVGISHYVAALGSARFWSAFVRTAVLTGMSVVLSTVLGLVMALVLAKDFKGARWPRTAMLLPMVATPVATSLVWSMMFNPSLGVLNYLLSLVGLPPSVWVADPVAVIPCIVLVDVWHHAPFAMMILLAALRSLPKEPFESAMIDGASRLQVFRFVTLPMLKSALVVVLIFRMIDALKVFDLIWIITAGGPGTASETLYVYAYNQAFKYLDLGYGSAVIILFTLVVAAASMVWVRQRDRDWA